jgi:hypothetical protein
MFYTAKLSCPISCLPEDADGNSGNIDDGNDDIGDNFLLKMNTDHFSINLPASLLFVI